jgi:hypothetical protein
VSKSPGAVTRFASTGTRRPGHLMNDDRHGGHDVANLTSRRPDGAAIGRRVCLDCDTVLGPLALCNRPTKQGRPCRGPVRPDLGHTVCWSHREDRGRTSTPRRRRAG